MKKRGFLTLLISWVLLGSGCADIPHPACLSRSPSLNQRLEQPSEWSYVRHHWYGDDKIPDDRYCEIPAIAKEPYRMPPHYSAWTVPERYFFYLPRQKIKDTINILAIGDSWFAYPKRGFAFDFWSDPRNVVQWLTQLSYPSSNILSLSNGGEIVTNMAGLAVQRPEEVAQSVHTEYSIPWVTARILRRMKDPSYSDHSFDYILISGGGNDFFPARVRRIVKPVPWQTYDK